MALSAISFVNRAKDDTRFDIKIDNKWHIDLNADSAITVLVNYECEQMELALDWDAEIMDWGVSPIDSAVWMVVL